MQNSINLIVLRVVAVLLLCAGALYILWRILPIITLVLLAIFIAVALDPLVNRLENRGWPRGRSVGVVFGSILTLMFILGALAFAPLLNQVTELTEVFPQQFDKIIQSEKIQRLEEKYELASQLQRVGGKIAEDALSTVSSFIQGLLLAFGTSILVLTMSVLFLYHGPNIVKITLVFFPKLAEAKPWTVLAHTYNNISSYLGGTFLVAFIGGLFGFVMMNILSVPQALALALIMAVFNMIPMVGAAIGSLPALVMAFTISPWTGFILMIALFGYQQVENAFISPRVIGRAIQVSALVVIIAVLVGYQLMGIIGIFFAVPLSATLQIFLSEYYHEQAVEMDDPNVKERHATIDGES